MDVLASLQPIPEESSSPSSFRLGTAKSLSAKSYYRQKLTAWFQAVIPKTVKQP